MSPNGWMVNRREFTGVGVPMRAHYQVGDDRIMAPAVELSMNRLFLETTRPDMQGTGSLEIIFGAAEEEGLVRAQAEVVRVLENGLGLKIVEIELDSYDFLKEVFLMRAQDPRQVEQELGTHLGPLPDASDSGDADPEVG